MTADSASIGIITNDKLTSLLGFSHNILALKGYFQLQPPWWETLQTSFSDAIISLPFPLLTSFFSQSGHCPLHSPSVTVSLPADRVCNGPMHDGRRFIMPPPFFLKSSQLAEWLSGTPPAPASLGDWWQLCSLTARRAESGCPRRNSIKGICQLESASGEKKKVTYSQQSVWRNFKFNDSSQIRWMVLKSDHEVKGL